MGIVRDTELRIGKVKLARVLTQKGVDAKPYEQLEVLAEKAMRAGGGSANIDGGSSSSVYLATQKLNSGSATETFDAKKIDGGGANG